MWVRQGLAPKETGFGVPVYRSACVPLEHIATPDNVVRSLDDQESAVAALVGQRQTWQRSIHWLTFPPHIVACPLEGLLRSPVAGLPSQLIYWWYTDGIIIRTQVCCALASKLAT